MRESSISWLTLGISLIAVIVSIRAAIDAHDAMLAAKVQADVAEQQVKPSFRFTRVQSYLSDARITLEVEVTNTGTVPTVVDAIRVDTLRGDRRGLYVFDNARNMIVYPGEPREFSTTKPR